MPTIINVPGNSDHENPIEVVTATSFVEKEKAQGNTPSYYIKTYGLDHQRTILPTFEVAQFRWDAREDIQQQVVAAVPQGRAGYHGN